MYLSILKLAIVPMKNILRRIYNGIPLKNKLFSAIRFFWSPPETVYRHLHFTGNFSARLAPDKQFLMRHYGSYLENEIFWGGVPGAYERHSLELWMELCKESKTILDIGANSGLYSLVAQTINSNATIYAFEPVERIYKRLANNIKLNSYSIAAVKKALSDSSGKRTIYDAPGDSEYIVSLSHNAFGREGIPVEIETDTLAGFIHAQKISRIDLMKLDVQFHEVEVLAGMQNLLAVHKPTLLIEILEDFLAEKIEKLTSGIGYLYFDIDEKRGPQRREHLHKATSYNFLICTSDVAKRLRLIK